MEGKQEGIELGMKFLEKLSSKFVNRICMEMTSHVKSMD
jgi:hypothetical protein